MLRPKLPLVLEEQIVHWPETALAACSLGGACRQIRVPVRVDERHVTEHEPQAAAEALSNDSDDDVRTCAVGTLVVAILDQRDRRVVRALRVVVRTNRDDKLHQNIRRRLGLSNAQRVAFRSA